MVSAALPVTPLNHLRDDARIFSAVEEIGLNDRLVAFSVETGVDFFVETQTFLPSGMDAGARSRQLMREWSNGRAAIIIAVDRSRPTTPTIQLSHALWDQFSSPN